MQAVATRAASVATLATEEVRTLADLRYDHTVTVRPYRPPDRPRVLELVNADRLVGQPVATPEMLDQALIGRSVIDAGWWAELENLATEVVVDPDGAVRGTLATAVRQRDGAGVLLWCHGREDPSIVSTLVARATDRLTDRRTLHAFHFATPLSFGLEALPVRRRTVTDRTLRAAGFVGRDLWRYAHRRLPAPELPVDSSSSVVRTTEEPAGWRIERRDSGRLIGEAVVTDPVQGIGLLSWISVDVTARGRGLSRSLLGTALRVLHDHGAREVVLYVDDDDPGGGRDRTVANHLYETSGFLEIDRLHSYTRPVGWH